MNHEDVHLTGLSRERIVAGSLRVILISTLILMVFTTITVLGAGEIQRDSWVDYGVFMTVTSIVAIVSAAPKPTPRVRIVIIHLLGILYGFYDITTYGLSGGGLIFLFLITISGAVMVAWQFGLILWVFSCIALFWVGNMVVLGQIVPNGKLFVVGELDARHVRWITLTFALFCGNCLAIVTFVLRDMERLWLRQRESLIELDQKSTQLAAAVTRESSLADALRLVLHKEQHLNQVKTDMLETIAHEFRTPLTVIKMSSTMVARFGAQKEAEWTAMRLAQIESAVGELTELLDGVVAVNEASFGTAAVAAIPVAELDAQLRLVAQTIDAELIAYTFTAASAETLTQSLPLLLQVWTQLLDNAVKFNRNNQLVEATCTWDGITLHCQVADLGIGIPEADLPFVFDSLYRGQNVGAIPGLGIGLYQAQQAVQLLLGTLTLSSSAESPGTVASLTVPNRVMG